MRIQAGSLVAGRYRLERALARGGMGSVWVARHTQLDVPVAIKFMAPAMATSTEARARFEREAKASAKLQSPYVVQVHDYGVDEEIPYIVMELLVGEDLGERLKRERRLPLKTTAGIVTQVAKALRRAHEEGIVHRDLKPSNIFIARKDDEEVVKVLDFGVAKARTSADIETTKTGAVIGSPHYMSPEQARNSKSLDHRSDLWSLGIVIFRAITGRHPFPAEELTEVILAICADPIPKPSDIAPDLGTDVDPFFARALSRDPAGRFQTAREMADAFAALAGTSPRLSSTSLPPPDAALESATAVLPLIREPQTQLLAGSPVAGGREPAGPDGTAGRGQSLADPLSFTGTLAPAGSTLSGAPRSNRAAVIAAAAMAGLVALCIVGVLAIRDPAPTPPGPSLAQAGAATVEGAPPPIPTVTATTPTATATAVVTASVPVPPLAAPTQITTGAPVEAPSATKVLATQPHGAPVPKEPPKKKEAAKKAESNPLLGF